MSDNRYGEWIETYTGRKFWPLDPRPEDIAIEDIAHALAQQCRFGGHTRKFYSVAQHSVLVAQLVEGPDRFWGLMHDAAEAYLVDVPRPIKYSPGFGDYIRAEIGIMEAVALKFRLPEKCPESVKLADDIACVNEARQLTAGRAESWGWGKGVPELGYHIRPLGPREAEFLFMETYERVRP